MAGFLPHIAIVPFHIVRSRVIFVLFHCKFQFVFDNASGNIPIGTEDDLVDVAAKNHRFGQCFCPQKLRDSNSFAPFFIYANLKDGMFITMNASAFVNSGSIHRQRSDVYHDGFDAFFNGNVDVFQMFGLNVIIEFESISFFYNPKRRPSILRHNNCFRNPV